MLLKGITDEDFVNYKVPSMFIATNTCSFKCDREAGQCICQNGPLVNMPSIDINISDIVDRYMNNKITKAIVFGGLEPMDQFDDIDEFLVELRIRRKCIDDVVIYTGYTEDEVLNKINILKYIRASHSNLQYNNIVIKYGRFIPYQKRHYDPVLGVYLASDNQYAIRAF